MSDFPEFYSIYLNKAKTVKYTELLGLLDCYVLNFRLASNLATLKVKGDDLVAYVFVSRVVFAYKAYEAVRKAAEIVERNTGIENPLIRTGVIKGSLYSRLTDNYAMTEYLVSQCTDPEIHDKLRLFYTLESHDCSIIAEALTKVFTRASFTPALINARDSKHRLTLKKLADELLFVSHSLWFHAVNFLGHAS